MRRLAWPILIPLLVVAVFATRVHLGFERIRFRVIDPIRRGLVAARSLRRFAALLPHAIVAGAFVWGVWQFYEPRTGFTPLIVFGEEFEPQTVPPLRRLPHHVVEGSGYDGQFYAQLALDPLLRFRTTIAALDNPSYRGRRVLFPMAAHVLGLGRPAWILQAYALLNVLAWFVLGWQLLRWLPPRAVRPTLAWTACMLGDGLATSVTKALLEGPSLPLVAAGIVYVERKRHWIATAIVGLSGLGRETNLLGGAMLAAARRSARHWILVGLVLVAPLAGWLIYLQSVGLPSVAMGGRNVTLPFVAFIEKWSVTIADLREHGWESLARYSLLALITVTTQALTLALRVRDRQDPWWRVGIAYAALLPLLGSAVWEGDPGAFARALLPMTVAFNILLPRSRWFWPLLILGNASVVHGLRELQLPWFSE